MGKKIIGYAAPFDMYGGFVKKGCVVKKTYYYYGTELNLMFPAEWVESCWLPVYEEEKIMIGEFEATFNTKEFVVINNIGFHKSVIDNFKTTLERKDVTSIKWHNSDVTLETINKIIERLNK